MATYVFFSIKTRKINIKDSVLLFPRNPVDFQTEAIQVPRTGAGAILNSILLNSGFRIIDSSDSGKNSLLPCPLGTFSNPFAIGIEGCLNCTPGELYNVF